jgi:multicomponent Na+:H+ antiporter subunit D
VAALLASALLTALYMLTIVVRAFFPGKSFDYSTIADVEDPNWMMILPLTLFVVAMFYFGLHSQTIVAALEQIAALTM